MRVILMPEAGRFWIMDIPFLIFSEKIFMDELDFRRIEYLKNNSSYDFFVYKTVSYLKDEGSLEIKDYLKRNIMKREDVKTIIKTSENLLKNLSPKDIIEIVGFSWKKYLRYISNKLYMLYPYERYLLSGTVEKVRTLYLELFGPHRIKNYLVGEALPSEILIAARHILAKVVSGIQIIKNTKLPTYDTSHYKKAVEIIFRDVRKNFLMSKVVERWEIIKRVYTLRSRLKKIISNKYLMNILKVKEEPYVYIEFINMLKKKISKETKFMWEIRQRWKDIFLHFDLYYRKIERHIASLEKNIESFEDAINNIVNKVYQMERFFKIFGSIEPIVLSILLNIFSNNITLLVIFAIVNFLKEILTSKKMFSIYVKRSVERVLKSYENISIYLDTLISDDYISPSIKLKDHTVKETSKTILWHPQWWVDYKPWYEGGTRKLVY